MISVWSLRNWAHEKKNIYIYLGFSLRSSCRINVAMTLIPRVNPIQRVSAMLMWHLCESQRLVPEASRERIGHAGKPKWKGGWAGGSEECHVQVSPRLPREELTQEQVGGCVCVCVCVRWGRWWQEILWEKNKAQDLYFLQPDIKKITTHKSINKIIFPLSHVLSVPLSTWVALQCVCACVRACVYIMSVLDREKL